MVSRRTHAPKTTPPNKRPTDAIVSERIYAVYTLVLKGASRKEILEHAVKNWDVSESTADVYTARARKMFEKQKDFLADERLGRALARLDDLYKRAMNVQDYKLCKDLIKEEANLIGYAAPVKSEVALTGTVSITDFLREDGE